MTLRELIDNMLAKDPDIFAKVARIAWNAYAQETLEKCPKSMISSWEETGEWGRNGNRRVANALIDFLIKTYEDISNDECSATRSSDGSVP
jgi:hypothetical protein